MQKMNVIAKISCYY